MTYKLLNLCTQNYLEYKDFYKMLSQHNNIGFIPGTKPIYNKDRYFIVGGGDCRGMAVSHLGTWTSKTDQKGYESIYISFPKPEDLFCWMFQFE